MHCTISSIISSYIAEMNATYFFTEFDAIEVQNAETAVVKVVLCLSPGTKSSNFLFERKLFISVNSK